MTRCSAVTVLQDRTIWLCGGAAVAHVRLGLLAFPICSAHDAIWTYGRSLMVLNGNCVMDLVPRFPPKDPDIEHPIPSA